MVSTDRDALVVLLHSTGGAGWKRNDNWGTDADISLWSGVEIDDQGCVVKLILEDNNLRGPIPTELGALTNLQDLSSNQLSGPIPEVLGALTNLQTLNLSSNELSGPIPEVLGALTNLQGLYLWNNQLSGPIPEVLGALTNLQGLYLSSNQLSGPIPEVLGALTNLQGLGLSSNQLSGPIPEVLGALTNLQYLDLSSNGLSGPIPEVLGALTNLQNLNLSWNKLSGPIPEVLGALTNLQNLNLSWNKLSGPIPEVLGALTNLQNLDLSSNQLSGPIPEVLGALTNLQHLNLRGNELSGPIPTELGALTNLQNLNLSSNQLSGLWNEEDHYRTPPSLGADGGPPPSELLAVLRVLEGANARLQGNPWQYPPLGVVNGGLSAVRKYFTAVYGESSGVVERPLKVVLIGKEKVGKTSLRQSIREGKACPTDDVPEARTVHIDVEDLLIHGDKVRVFDCAGQEAYYGSLQLFFTIGAVYLLTVDMASAVHNVVESAQHPLAKAGVLQWVQALIHRVPKAAVILVGTKCDLVTDLPDLSSLERLEDAAKVLETKISSRITSWTRQNSSAEICIEKGMRLVHFDQSAGSSGVGHGTGWPCDFNEPGLLGRILRDPSGHKRAVSMRLPSSWSDALEFLDECSRRRSEHRGFQGVSKKQLYDDWREESKTRGANGIDWNAAEAAMDGALLLRASEGGLVVYGSYVFFDVHWLTDVLKPLLSETLVTSDGCRTLGGMEVPSAASNASLHRFEKKGLLEPALAEVLWGEETAPHVLKTLESAGLTFPRHGDECGGLVVLLRLPKERPEHVGIEMERFRREQTDGGRSGHIKVVGTFHGGVPPGFIERLLTKCCYLGACDPFWRFGVWITSGDLFSVSLGYHESDELVGTLTLEVFGDCTTAGPWGGMSACLSVIVQLLSEFPGMSASAEMECQQHLSGKIPIELHQSKEWAPLIRSVDGCDTCAIRPGRDNEVVRRLLLNVPVTDPPVDIEAILPKFEEAASSEQEILSRWAEQNQAERIRVAEAEAAIAAAQREAEAKTAAEEAEVKAKHDEEARTAQEAARAAHEAARAAHESAERQARQEEAARAAKEAAEQQAKEEAAQVQAERFWKTLMGFFVSAAAALLAAVATLAAADNEKPVLWGICLGLGIICLVAAAGSFVARSRVPPIVRASPVGEV